MTYTDHVTLAGMQGLRSLLIVTLDSCRLDTSIRADITFLRSLGAPQAARTHGSFTLPAHTALFAGYPPAVLGARISAPFGVLGTLPRIRAHTVWPGGSSWSMGNSWLDTLRSNGIRTVGAGGVRWFLHEQLRCGFDVFHYWGPPHRDEDLDLPIRTPDEFALSHVEVLLDTVEDATTWLLFVNVSETHAPYTSERGLVTAQRKIAQVRNGKELLPESTSTTQLMADLHGAQVQALEQVDAGIQHLFETLPKPFDYLICADHGESFGEDRMWGHVLATDPVITVPLWTGTAE